MIIVRLDGMPDDQIYSVDTIFTFNNFVSHVTSTLVGGGGWPKKVFVQCPEVLEYEWHELQGVYVYPGMSAVDIQKAFSSVRECWYMLDARADIVNEVRENPSFYALNTVEKTVGTVVHAQFRKRN